MNITQTLKNDHKQILQLFEEVEEALNYSPDKVYSMFRLLDAMLEVHTLAEEQAVYGPLITLPYLKNDVLEKLEDHKAERKLCRSMASMDPNSISWTLKLEILKESIEHHIQEEETQLLLELEQEFSDHDLDEINKIFLQAKENLEKEIYRGTLVFA